jgi:hypothetical protein
MPELRHEDENPPLSPAEAREFMEVYAEREAKAATPEGETRLRDVAELLGLEGDEAKRILHEARQRLAARPQTKSRNSPRWTVFAAFTSFGFMILALLVAGTQPRGAAPPIMAPAIVETPAVSVQPPDGMEIQVDLHVNNAGLIESAGAPAKFGTDFTSLTDAERSALQGGLTRAIVHLVDQNSMQALESNGSRSISVGVRILGGEWKSLELPLKPFTLPLQNNPKGREYLEQKVRSLVKEHWSSIVTTPSR